VLFTKALLAVIAPFEDVRERVAVEEVNAFEVDIFACEGLSRISFSTGSKPSSVITEAFVPCSKPNTMQFTATDAVSCTSVSGNRTRSIKGRIEPSVTMNVLLFPCPPSAKPARDKEAKRCISVSGKRERKN
jgi:hypothetical protein